jgi:hypothetical protein
MFTLVARSTGRKFAWLQFAAIDFAARSRTEKGMC